MVIFDNTLTMIKYYGIIKDHYQKVNDSDAIGEYRRLITYNTITLVCAIVFDIVYTIPAIIFLVISTIFLLTFNVIDAIYEAATNPIFKRILSGLKELNRMREK